MSELDSSQEIKKHWLKTLSSVGKKCGDAKGFNQRLQGVMPRLGADRHMETHKPKLMRGYTMQEKVGAGGMYRGPDSVLIA